METRTRTDAPLRFGDVVRVKAGRQGAGIRFEITGIGTLSSPATGGPPRAIVVGDGFGPTYVDDVERIDGEG